jgi:hypothetical protein
MASSTKQWVALVAVVIIAIGGYFFPASSKLAGNVSPTDISATNFTEVTASNGILIGSAGTGINQLLHGTCTATVYASLAATSSQLADCTVAGALPGDHVFVALPNSANAGENFAIAGSAASSTAGHIAFTIENLTGAATSSYAQATTGVEYLDLR